MIYAWFRIEGLMEKNKGKFGLFTCISMIAGIVIGSGIFFKTDDVLVATGGSVFMGVLLWVVGAIGIVFGGLCVAEYSKVNAEAGGLITYCEMAWGKTWGYLAGWFQIIFYFPALAAILAWITAIYIALLFGISDSNHIYVWIISLLVIVGVFILNVYKTMWASRFQNISLVIKISVLVVLALTGIIFGDVSNLEANEALVTTPNLFAGLIACAFAYDGWFVAPSITHELKNPKRNLPLALIFAPILIMSVYLAYFIGINLILGPEMVMALGDGSVGYIVSRIFGEFGTKLVYITVIISVLGACNGLTLGYIRMPFALAIRKEIPGHTFFSRIDRKTGVSLQSALFCFIIVIFWFVLHIFSQFSLVLGPLNFSGFEIDSLPIVLTYFFYVSLYIRLLMKFIEEKRYAALFLPLMALFGALLVIYGGMSQDNALIYFVISFLGIAAGLVIKPKIKKD